MEFKYVKIVVYVPQSHCDAVRKVLAEKGAGKIGNYDSCSFTVNGTGRFRPLEGSEPYMGREGVIEEVTEVRIETVAPVEIFQEIIEAVREVHPYEEAVIDVMPLLNLLGSPW